MSTAEQIIDEWHEPEPCRPLPSRAVRRKLRRRMHRLYLRRSQGRSPVMRLWLRIIYLRAYRNILGFWEYGTRSQRRHSWRYDPNVLRSTDVPEIIVSTGVPEASR